MRPLLPREGEQGLVGEASERAPIFSFTLPYAHPHDIATILNEYGAAIRAGHHCTQPLMDRFCIPGTVRASFAHYNTKEDIDLLVKGVERAASMLR